MHLIASIRVFVCVLMAEPQVWSKELQLPAWVICLRVCNQGAFADNLADAVHWILILFCYFFFCRNITYGKFTYDFDIRFDHTLTNIGEAYSEHTSFVTIPWDGAYVFMFNIAGGNSNTLVWLLVNGLKVASAWGHYSEENPYPVASNQVISIYFPSLQ